MIYEIEFKEEATRDLVALAKSEPKAFSKAQALIAELRSIRALVLATPNNCRVTD